jgi:TPP-dependent 2-oxoacid decarboxylase
MRNIAGHYWGSISTGCTCESVEASDLVLAVGCAWTDYSTLGYSLLLQPGKVVTVGADRVTIKGGETYGCIDMEVRGVTAQIVTWQGCDYGY